MTWSLKTAEQGIINRTGLVLAGVAHGYRECLPCVKDQTNSNKFNAMDQQSTHVNQKESNQSQLYCHDSK